MCKRSLLVCSLFVLGCGQGKDVAPVSGLVTLDGEPLAGASVAFQPIGANPGSGSYGRTDSEGRFSLQLVNPDEPGAVVGRHRVSITLSEGESSSDAGPVVEKVPARYNRNSELEVEVPAGGADSVRFDLRSR